MGRYPSALREHVMEGRLVGLCVCILSKWDKYKLSFSVSDSLTAKLPGSLVTGVSI